jgi:hypothetical protein
MKTLIAASTMVLMSTGVAFAQDDMGDGSSDTSSDTSSTDSSSDGGSMGGSMGSGETGGTTGTEGAQMGIETSLNGVAGIPAVHLLYNLGGNYIDAIVSLDIENHAPEVGDGFTSFGLGIGVGYRMYNDMDGRIHPYLEPYLSFNLNNSGQDTVPNETDIGAGAMLGVDFQLFDQFTLGAALGGGLNYSIISDTENVLSIGVYTTSVNATFWWG